MAEKRESKGEKKIATRWWFWGLSVFIATLIILFILSAIGLIGRTVVEREVFEKSFQYSEARKTAIAAYEAQLAEISRKLTGDIDSQTETNLEAQAAAIRIQLSTERGKQ